MTSFAARLQQRIASFGPLCVGIDPARATLLACGLPDSAEGALEFGKRILDAADYELSIVKPQAAYFERFGSAGWRALEALAALARAREVLVLLDCKRGDIDTTAEAYAEAYFAPASSLRVDAATVSPYLGLAALRPFFEFAARNAGGAFVVVRSSNREAQGLQTAMMANGSTVARDLCHSITAFNREYSETGVGPLGAVVGATCADAADTLRDLPQSFILAPGVGAQGATMHDIAAGMGQARGRVLPNVSRAVIAAGGTASDIASTLRQLKADAAALA